MSDLLNEITQGDCLEVMERIPNESIDMVLCDLPYGTTQNKWDSIICLEQLWKHYDRITKENGAIILTAQTPFDKILGASNIKNLKYEWIWQKTEATGFLNAKKMPLKNHENILVFYKKTPTYNPQYTEGKPYSYKKEGITSTNYGESTGTELIVNDGKRHPLTIQTFKKDKGLHPTQKPVALFEYLIRTYTNEGEVVLDNCIGSGTTAIAAINTGRQFIGIEREPEYVAIANERIQQALIEKGA
ncbi:site-specific DNA-methyltransferase [Gottfriedia sp. S16(2024)]|uniref:DNA-methyltransferase n=1 Tax=Gottfriedia sp. S16(2024) TaxID=3162883 RepID=UPI003D203A5A